MSIIVDLIVVAIVALFTILGYKQGLVKAAIKIFSFFIAIAVAFALYKPISSVVINNTSLDDNIKNTIIEKTGLNEKEEIQIENSIISKMTGEVQNTVEDMANTFSIKIIETGTLLILFIITKIALKFVSILTDLITKLPILKQINKLRRNYIRSNKRYNYGICITCNCVFSIPICK